MIRKHAQKNVKVNPSSQFEPAFYVSGNGKGTKNMVVLPYKDRLELFSKYLQQLVMESLGKEELDSDGKIVNQGICVLGNKGSTDQNSHIQQLRDGLNDFFVTFIEVQKYQLGEPVFTEVDATSGDFLEGFFLGTRSALAEKNRESIAITVNDASVFTIRLLIALFERAVGYYASLVKINAYHQPGVEAGKKAAGNVLTIQREIISHLKQNLNQKFSVFQISNAIGQAGEVETVFKIIEHLAANPCEK